MFFSVFVLFVACSSVAHYSGLTLIPQRLFVCLRVYSFPLFCLTGFDAALICRLQVWWAVCSLSVHDRASQHTRVTIRSWGHSCILLPWFKQCHFYSSDPTKFVRSYHMMKWWCHSVQCLANGSTTYMWTDISWHVWWFAVKCSVMVPRGQVLLTIPLISLTLLTVLCEIAQHLLDAIPQDGI